MNLHTTAWRLNILRLTNCYFSTIPLKKYPFLVAQLRVPNATRRAHPNGAIIVSLAKRPLSRH